MKLYTAPDPDGLLFGLISSAMFMAWQKMVGGRLKSDPSFSITLVWNNFPLPGLDEEQRASVIEAGREVEQARLRHPKASLSVLYNPSRTPQNLATAHAALDAVVDAAFGLDQAVLTDLDRQTALFAMYAELARGFTPCTEVAGVVTSHPAAAG